MNKEAYLQELRHSAAHLLAAAVLKLYPDTKHTIGPAIDSGFYYDFDLPKPISEEDLPKIEAEMSSILKTWDGFTHREVTEEEARKFYKDNPYKLELIDGIVERGEKITFYKAGSAPEKEASAQPVVPPKTASHHSTEIPERKKSDAKKEFEDLCEGGHSQNPQKDIAAFKLLSLAGAYWRGSEKNKMLTRIYGTAYPSQKELEKHLVQLEEAKARDHKKLGKELDLFVFTETVGKGLPLWTPKGATIRRILERFIVDEELKRGYQHVYTPDLANVSLYEKSGHYPYYKDSMYAPIEIDEERFMLRPMTCPHHFELYLNKPHSYKELPVRYAELAHLYRYEKSGELSGLERVRTFTLADAHIIAQENQTEQEVTNVLNLIDDMAQALGLTFGEDYFYRLSLGDRADEKKYFKDDDAWEHAEGVLRSALQKRLVNFDEAPGEAAFYGPKIDIQMKNVNGKEETAFTVQYDFVMPKRFNLTFINKDGDEEQAAVIHRSSIGAIERLMAFLIEHYAGAFPLWLAPVQILLLPIADRHNEFTQQKAEELRIAGFRVEADLRSERLQAKIRDATLQKVPFMGIIGDKEIAEDAISVRKRGGEDLGQTKIASLIKKLQENIDKKI